LARCFVTVPESRSIILGPSERQVSSVVAHTFRDLLRGTYPGFEVGRQVIENPALGSSVVVVPASEGSAQGVRPHRGRVVIDEAHEFPADPEARADSEVGGALNLLLSQAEDPGSQVWLLGMLGSKDGYLHWLRDLAADGAVPHCLFSYETDPLALNPTLTPEFLAQRQAEMLPVPYRVHFENAVAESAGSLFPHEVLQGARERGAEWKLHCPVTQAEFERLTYLLGPLQIAVGFDRAWSLRAGADRSCLTCVGRPLQAPAGGDSPVFLLACETLAREAQGEGDILAAMVEMRKLYGGRIDAGGLDATQTIDLAQKARRALGVAPAHWHVRTETRELQTHAFGLLGRLCKDRLVIGEGPDGDTLVRQLASLRAHLSRDLETATFRAGSGHDDSAHSASLAVMALIGRRDLGGGTDALTLGDRKRAWKAFEEGDVRALHDAEKKLGMDARARRRWDRARYPRPERW
jgi:hypothetical protein